MASGAEERKFAKWCASLGYECIKFSSPGKAGVPDRIVLMPGGRILFVEMKNKGEKLSTLQEFWRERLEEKGFAYRVCTTKDEAVQATREYIEQSTRDRARLPLERAVLTP